MTDAERRKADRRRDDNHWGSRVQVFWRGPKGAEGEAASGGGQVMLSNNCGTVLSFNRETYDDIVAGWEQLKFRESAK